MVKALLLEEADGAVTAAVRELDDAQLPEGDVTVDVKYSTLNYKDGMIVKGLGRLVRHYPHVPGIDFVGTVRESTHDRYAPGDRVILTGWRVGEAHWGGYAQRARVKGDWLVPLPEGLTPRRAMAIGTAGFTAMLAIMALEEHGLTPGAGDVLVTGAAGGVGSVSTAVLATLGYHVTACTGRPENAEYLQHLGAAAIIERAELAEPTARPLESERWAACVDAVAGTTLSRLLKQVRYGGAVAAVGLAGGDKLETSVMPFLLRGISLLGIDSVQCPFERRTAAWGRLTTDLPPELLDGMVVDATLADVPRLAADILQGQVRGRVVVDVNA